MREKGLPKFVKPDRVVTPRKREYRRLPVIAIHGDHAMTENGEVITEQALLKALPKMPTHIFIKLDAASWVAQRDAHWRDRYPGTWNCRFVTKENQLIVPNGFMRATREQVIAHYFGWGTSGKGSYHKILDPFIFFETKPPTENGVPYIQTLLNWGVALRDFCDENGIEVRCTAGALAGQFLTDPRFYPDARRKVPRRTNDKVREVLPGNYYSLTVVPRADIEYTAYYFDQQSAHHYHASKTVFPHADELYAYGRFIDLSECVFPDTWEGWSGLYCLDLRAPSVGSPRWVREWLQHLSGETDTLEKRFVYSNELPHLRDLGYRVIGVRAAWGSHKRDTGLNRYAEWASKELERNPSPWLKRLLLATYGVLAITPKDHLSLYARAKKGELATVRIGREHFTGYRIQQRVKLEPRIANVLHRGLIEAACRSESIGYADWLDRQGYNILSIYSDAVIVEVNDDLPEPLSIEPWRLKRTLHHLQFINSQAYKSAEETKIPGGVGREILKFIQRSPGHSPRPKGNKWGRQEEPTSTSH